MSITAADDQPTTELLLFLPDREAVLQHRSSAVHRVIAQCGVHASVAIMLLIRHQGNVDAACRASFLQPVGKPTLLCR